MSVCTCGGVKSKNSASATQNMGEWEMASGTSMQTQAVQFVPNAIKRELATFNGFFTSLN